MWRSLPVVGRWALVAGEFPAPAVVDPGDLANDERPTANDDPKDFRSKLQNSVDTLFILPQYLVI
jgi:hypothetical protein